MREPYLALAAVIVGAWEPKLLRPVFLPVTALDGVRHSEVILGEQAGYFFAHVIGQFEGPGGRDLQAPAHMPENQIGEFQRALDHFWQGVAH